MGETLVFPVRVCSVLCRAEASKWIARLAWGSLVDRIDRFDSTVRVVQDEGNVHLLMKLVMEVMKVVE